MDSNAKGVSEATPRPWLREIHDARGDDARIAIVSRNAKFTSGYYVICADDMRMRRDQTVIDYGLICEAVNSYDALQADLQKAQERWASDVAGYSNQLLESEAACQRLSLESIAIAVKYDALQAENRRLREVLTELMTWGVELDDPRLRYIVAQVDKGAIEDARQALRGEE